MRKALVILFIVILTFYSPVELTRLIVSYGLSSELIRELAYIWGFYLLAILTLIKVVRV